MTYPLIFLAILSVCAGWVGLPWLQHGFASFLSHGSGYDPHANWLLMIISTVVAVSGIGLAYLIYYKKSISADGLAEKFKGLHTLLYNKYYIDELYDLILLQPTMAFGRLMWRFDAGVIDGLVNGTARATMLWSDLKMWIDKWIVDGAVNGSGWIVCQAGNFLRYLQTGRVQFYTFFAMMLVVLVALIKLESGSPDNEAGLPLLSILLAAGIMFLAVLSRSVGQQPSAAETKQEENI
jgi:NADH-quinone oxidoreductase subunit L